jgi:hypothetical protein
LKEQLRDLMFFIDGQQKLKEMTDVSVEELETSQVIVNSPTVASASSTPTTHPNKSRRRKK